MDIADYKKFRKQILGMEAEDESILLLGPFAIHKLNSEEIDYAEMFLDRKIGDGEFVLYNSVSKAAIIHKVPMGKWRSYFDNYLIDYCGELDRLPDAIKESFEDVIDDIKGYLKKRYDGIKPKQDHFVKWFMKQIPSPSIYIIVRKFPVFSEKIGFLKPPLIVLTPEGMEKTLHAYCKWKKEQQDRIFHELHNQDGTNFSLKKNYNNINNLVEEQATTIVENKNIFNNMDIKKVRGYFGQLTIKKSKNGQPFLTEEQLNAFIQRAFLGNTNIEKIKANFTPNVDATAIKKLFYRYYDDCKELGIASKRGSKGEKKGMEEYLRLLTDNIEGFNFESIVKNFNNSDNHTMKWNKLSDY